uniref:arabinogalactan protein 16-like n=1 Tax=Erigeron canadensis TaxID=72917 RepID=UPI001CB9BB2D|nr:arabinogalactan protein 16-like [Erigeron canadensis]
MAALRGAVVTALAVMLMISAAVTAVDAQSFPPAPAPAPAPSSDGTSIDQGIAYALMIGALLLTYLIHPLDAFPFGLF